MATLNRKIKEYLKDNNKTYEEERKNYVLQNDGSGDYIKSWNVTGLAKPNDSQIASYETTANNSETLNVILRKRKKLYGSWESQLEEINEKGLDAWKERIAQIKADNPKE